MLIPKKAKEFVKPTADELQIDENLVQDLVDFYWKDVRKALSSLKGPRIKVDNFGSFRVKHWLLEKEKESYQKYLDKGDPDKMTFQKHKIRSEVEQRLTDISNMMKMVEGDQDKKQQIKAKRNGAITEGDLESPDANS